MFLQGIIHVISVTVIGNAACLPQLVPEQVLKLKQLTVLTLAETDKVLFLELKVASFPSARGRLACLNNVQVLVIEFILLFFCWSPCSKRFYLRKYVYTLYYKIRYWNLNCTCFLWAFYGEGPCWAWSFSKTFLLVIFGVFFLLTRLSIWV